jgi:beta-glucosidase
VTDEQLRFPAGFGWGTATAAYQVEGGVTDGGRGPSIWDTFCRVPGAIANGETGDVACDHYHRYPEDLDLLGWLNAPYYRFSISWPRVQPAGRGPLNPVGLAFYQRLVDGLLDRGLRPWITLYHWDLPQPLQDAGGWPARDTTERFAEYAAAVHNRLGDRVVVWTTLNEPWCSAMVGHAEGRHAPGVRDPHAAVAAMHHLLLGHGLATQALRAAGCRQIGLTLNQYPCYPASTDPADVEAATRIDALVNRAYLEPVFRGRYPADLLEHLARHTDIGSLIRPGDLDTISAEIDLLGVNYYRRHVLRHRSPAGQSKPSPWLWCDDIEFVRDDLPRTAMGWQIFPDGLRTTLARIASEYTALPLWITESGAAFPDRPGADGSVDDQARIDYLAAHFRSAHQAIADGIDLRGYFVWSFLDNFEWSYGYDRRFGLVHVDYQSLRRTPKRSADWYRRVIAANAVPA